MTADGPVNTESGGNSQPSQVRWGRGAAGAFDPQFTNRYHLPINLINPAPTPEDKPADDRSPFIPDAVGWLGFLIKISFLLFFYVWMRWTLPRYRYDQLMTFGWKVLLPASVLNLLFVSAWVLYFGF